MASRRVLLGSMSYTLEDVPATPQQMSSQYRSQEIPALVRHLRSGVEAAQLHTAEALTWLALGGDSDQRAIAAQGGIPALAQLFARGGSSGHPRTLVGQSVGVVVMRQPGNTAEFVACCGARAALDHLVRSPREHEDALATTAMMLAAAMCREYTGADDVRRALVAAGGVPALVRMMRGAKAARVVASKALGGLADSACADFKAAVMAAGAVPLLAACLRSSDAKEAAQAAAALANIAHEGGPGCVAAVVAAGAVPACVELLDRSPRQAKFAAAWLLLYVAMCRSEHHARAITAAGGLPALVRCLGDRSGTVQAAAAGTIHHACLQGPEHARACDAADTRPALGRLLRTSDGSVRSMAAAALAAWRCQLARTHDRGPAASRPPAPTSSQPRPPTQRVCAAPGCGGMSGLRRCGGCGAVRYCSEACCRAHWRDHKAECRRLQAEQEAAATAEDQQL